MRFWTPRAVLVVAAAGAFALATSTSAAELITFTIKFPPGQIDHQTTNMHTEQTFSGDAFPAPIKHTTKMSVKTTFKGIKSDAAGSQVELDYDSVKMSMSNLGHDASDELDKTLAAIVGSKVTLHFTPAGKADKVEGIDAMVAKFPQGPQRAAVEQFLNDERIKDTINLMTGLLLPSKPVNVGDTWDTDVSCKFATLNVMLKSRVTLVSIDERDGHKIAKLEFTGKGKLDAAPGAGAPKMNVEQFDQDGKAEFDLTRGWITSQVIDQHLKGDVSVNVNGPKPFTTKFEMTMKGTSTITAEKPEAATSAKQDPAKK
jgi:hypothetical protein